MFLLLLLSLSLFAANSMAQVYVPRRPSFKPLESIDLPRLAGQWYEAARIPNILELAVTCSRAKIVIGEKTGIVSLLFSETGSFTGRDYKVLTTGTQKAGQTAAVYDFNFPLYFVNIKLATIYVLDTDYDHFIVLAGGIPVGDGYLEFAWIDSRTPQLAPEYLERAYKALHNSGITNKLVPVPQNC